LLEQGKTKDTILGVPQGGIASPTLFNIYMHEFDEFIISFLIEKFESINFIEKRTLDKNISQKYYRQMILTNRLRRDLALLKKRNTGNLLNYIQSPKYK
jgi:retron-type reverse transcriptase